MSAAVNWIQDLKDAPINVQYCVFGYMRTYEKKLSLNVIPSRVIYLVLLFYYEREHFDKSPECIEISEDQRTITRTDKGDSYYWTNLTFLKKWIDSTSNQLIEWTFKVDKKDGNDAKDKKGICIGIYSDYNDKYLTMNPIDDAMNPPFYVLWANNQPEKGKIGSCAWSRECGDRCNKTLTTPAATTSNYSHHDVIKFRYHTKESKVYFKINDGADGLLFDNIQKSEKIKYKMAIALAKIGDSISLIDFKQSNVF